MGQIGHRNKVSISGLKKKGGRYADSPAPGYRNYTLGALSGVGNEGSVWSASASGIGGLDLYFHITGLYLNSSNGRGYGFQLRCLSE
ncbi:hypothetical protein [uncultured Rikenella sp.]|uniref:hypothetical protein n=1 Tax=uncultured Rikenella sp. TaxID=368003 RepID=UPI0025EED3F8|nr:hypothetical protein [uncultured Rikenella sp.]